MIDTNGSEKRVLSFCLILYHGAGRLARLMSGKPTSGDHLFRNERTKLKLILVAFCSESGSLFLNLDRAFFGFTEKITRGSIQRNCLFPLSVSDPPNFFDFQSWGDLFLRPLFGGTSSKYFDSLEQACCMHLVNGRLKTSNP